MVHASYRPIYHLFEPQGSTVCIPSSRPTSMGNICSEHKLVNSIHLPSNGSPSQGDLEYPSVQLFHNHSSPRLGPSAALNGDPTPITSINNTSQAISQPSLPQQPTITQPSYLASGSEQLQQQGFSVEETERIVALQFFIWGFTSLSTLYRSHHDG